MRNATKFTFDTVFAGNRDGAADPANQRRILGDAEIDALCAEARAQGRQAAEVFALEAVAAGAREVAHTIVQAIRKSAEDMETLRAESSAIAMMLARKLAGAAVAQFPDAEVEAALRQAMHQAIGEPRIVLHARPEIVEALSARVPEIAHEEGYDGRVQISSDATLRGADCRIEWRGGGAERATAVIDAALDALMARRFQTAATNTETRSGS